MLQASFSSKAGQAYPPFSAPWTTPLPLVLVPPPQVALHLVHVDQNCCLCYCSSAFGNPSLFQTGFLACLVSMELIRMQRVHWCWVRQGFTRGQSAHHTKQVIRIGQGVISCPWLEIICLVLGNIMTDFISAIRDWDNMSEDREPWKRQGPSQNVGLVQEK